MAVLCYMRDIYVGGAASGDRWNVAHICVTVLLLAAWSHSYGARMWHVACGRQVAAFNISILRCPKAALMPIAARVAATVAVVAPHIYASAAAGL